MCIIVSKKMGANIPNKETLKRCFDYNSDGAGFAYSDGKILKYKKGLMSFKKFYKEIKKLKVLYNDNQLKNIALVMHFRIGTSGGINKEKTHPFIISNIDSELNKTNYENCELLLFHNGVMQSFASDKKLSDTQQFIKKIMFPLYQLKKDFFNNDDINKLVEHIIGNSNKLCLIDKKGKITYYNKHLFIEENGVLYSNQTYKQHKNILSSYYNDWDDWDYRYYNNSSVYNKYSETQKKVDDVVIQVKDDENYNLIDNKNNIYKPLINGEVIEIKKDNKTIFTSKTQLYYTFNNNIYQYQFKNNIDELILKNKDIIIYKSYNDYKNRAMP